MEKILKNKHYKLEARIIPRSGEDQKPKKVLRVIKPEDQSNERNLRDFYLTVVPDRTPDAFVLEIEDGMGGWVDVPSYSIPLFNQPESKGPRIVLSILFVRITEELNSQRPQLFARNLVNNFGFFSNNEGGDIDRLKAPDGNDFLYFPFFPGGRNMSACVGIADPEDMGTWVISGAAPGTIYQ